MYIHLLLASFFFFFFFNDTATTEIYTLSLHDALPISEPAHRRPSPPVPRPHHLLHGVGQRVEHAVLDRKSTRLNSSHSQISYAVFCLKKKKKIVLAIVNSSHGSSEHFTLTAPLPPSSL